MPIVDRALNRALSHEEEDVVNIISIVIVILVTVISAHIFFKVVVTRYRKMSLISHIGKCVLLALGNADGWDEMLVEMLGDFRTDKRMQTNTLDDFTYLTEGIHNLHENIQDKSGNIIITIALDDSRTSANKAILEIFEVLTYDPDTIVDRTEALESRILPSIKELMDIKWGTAVA